MCLPSPCLNLLSLTEAHFLRNSFMIILKGVYYYYYFVCLCGCVCRCVYVRVHSCVHRCVCMCLFIVVCAMCVCVCAQVCVQMCSPVCMCGAQKRASGTFLCHCLLVPLKQVLYLNLAHIFLGRASSQQASASLLPPLFSSELEWQKCVGCLTCCMSAGI